jgi:hypothetical protein
MKTFKDTLLDLRALPIKPYQRAAIDVILSEDRGTLSKAVGILQQEEEAKVRAYNQLMEQAFRIQQLANVKPGA